MKDTGRSSSREYKDQPIVWMGYSESKLFSDVTPDSPRLALVSFLGLKTPKQWHNPGQDGGLAPLAGR